MNENVRVVGDEKKLHRVTIKIEATEKTDELPSAPTAICFQVEGRLLSETSVDVDFLSALDRDALAKQIVSMQSKYKRINEIKDFEKSAFCAAIIEVFEQLKNGFEK